MALTIYPTIGYDSFITEADATTVITKNSLQSAQWIALPSATKEVYLRLATELIMNSVSTDSTNETGYLDSLTYVAANSCLPKSCAMIAMNDLVYSISSDINPNTGLISKEKVGDIEVTYFHGANASAKQLSSLNKNPFPKSVIPCLTSYGANIYPAGISQTTLSRS